MMQNGIDVANINGAIDWQQVKASGIDFVIIRAGWTHYAGGLTEDKQVCPKYGRSCCGRVGYRRICLFL